MAVTRLRLCANIISRREMHPTFFSQFWALCSNTKCPDDDPPWSILSEREAVSAVSLSSVMNPITTHPSPPAISSMTTTWPSYIAKECMWYVCTGSAFEKKNAWFCSTDLPEPKPLLSLGSWSQKLLFQWKDCHCKELAEAHYITHKPLYAQKN